MKTFNLTQDSKISERLISSQTLSKLKFDLSQELLEEYKSRFPTRTYLLEGVRLTRSACIAFQFRTETLKTKDWRYRHKQPLDTEPFNSTCRLCGSQKETVTHLVQDCTSERARQARRVIKSSYIKSKKDIPAGPYEIFRRSEET